MKRMKMALSHLLRPSISANFRTPFFILIATLYASFRNMS